VLHDVADLVVTVHTAVQLLHERGTQSSSQGRASCVQRLARHQRFEITQTDEQLWIGVIICITVKL
jgi:hypothetical protein